MGYSISLTNIYNEGNKLFLFHRVNKVLKITKEVTFQPYFYQESATGVFRSIDNKRVRKVECKSPYDISKLRDEKSYEADVPYCKRFIIDKVTDITKTELKYFFIDIEVLTKALPDYNNPIQPIICISLYNSYTKSIRTWFINDYEGVAVEEQEDKLLADFCKYIYIEQPDILCGWNFTQFDYPYIFNRMKKELDINFSDMISPLNKSRYGMEDISYPAGISIIDYLDWFKKIKKSESSYALDSIAQVHLNEEPYKKTDFNHISEEIKEKNINDIKRLVKLEEKFKIIHYYDELRRMGKCLFEDLNWNCLDDKTEILTEEGWKKYNTINKNDRVFSVDLTTEKLELKNINEIFIYDYNGTLIDYDNERVNFCCTANHRFLMKYNIKGKRIKEFDFYEADKIPKGDRYNFLIGTEGFNGNNKSFSDNQIRLMGWIITEGHFDKTCRAISIYQNKGYNADIIRNLLKELKLDFKEYHYPYCKTTNKIITFRISKHNADYYINSLCKKKEIPSFCYDLPIHQKRLLVETLMMGDGHWATERSGVYYSANQLLIEQFQLLATLSGYNVYIKKTQVYRGKTLCTCYAGQILKKKYTVYRPKRKKYIPYSGKIWCISTPYENFIIRRNDKIVISGNSKVIDMLLLQEAKQKSIVLPSKLYSDEVIINEEDGFEGAYRRADLGLFENLYKLDLSSAYPAIINNLCLDISNINETEGLPINITDRETNEVLYTIKMKQNLDALLPTVARKLIIKKDILKKKLSELSPDSPEYDDLQTKYDCTKALVNSLFGVCGLKVFRLYNKHIASAITSIVRSLLHYVEDKLQAQGMKVIYIDTDAIFTQAQENPQELLNGLVVQWAKETFNKDKIDIKFDYEGKYIVLLIVALCRYVGDLLTPKGKIKREIKGVEIKRKDSSVFMKKFQETLINKVLQKEPQDKIIEFINIEKERIKTVPIIDIGFPCKVNNTKVYKSIPIFSRALDYTKELVPGFDKPSGDMFYYIHVEKFGTAIRKSSRMKKNKETGKKELQKSEKEMDMNVLAFDSDTNNHIKKEMINWTEMIRKTIVSKAEAIFDAMKWDFSEIEPIKEIIPCDLLECKQNRKGNCKNSKDEEGVLLCPKNNSTSIYEQPDLLKKVKKLNKINITQEQVIEELKKRGLI